jgi:hypothetical protein
MAATSGVTKIVEYSVAGFASLMTFLTSLKGFITPSADEDSTAIKFSDIDDEQVELSLNNADEDDIRNTERTIEYWCTCLRFMKISYTIYTMFGSFLLIVFIILDLTFKEDTSVLPINLTLITFGGVACVIALLNLSFLKRFTFTGDGEKDIEQFINGVIIYIKRQRAHELKKLKKYLCEVPKSNDFMDSILKKFFNSKQKNNKHSFLHDLIGYLTNVDEDKQNEELNKDLDIQLNIITSWI